jgi:cytochrome c oxidase subunit 2
MGAMMTRETIFPIVLILYFGMAPVGPSSQAGDVKRGKALFSSKSCVGCHAIGSTGAATTGPNLAGVTRLRTVSWLKKWIQHPEQMATDPAVKKLAKKYPATMPNLGVSDTEADDLIAYLKSQDKKKK